MRNFNQHTKNKTKVKAELQLNPPKEQLDLAKPYDPNKMTYGGVKDAFVANALYDGAKFVSKRIERLCRTNGIYSFYLKMQVSVFSYKA